MAPQVNVLYLALIVACFTAVAPNDLDIRAVGIGNAYDTASEAQHLGDCVIPLYASMIGDVLLSPNIQEADALEGTSPSKSIGALVGVVRGANRVEALKAERKLEEATQKIIVFAPEVLDILGGNYSDFYSMVQACDASHSAVSFARRLSPSVHPAFRSLLPVLEKRYGIEEADLPRNLGEFNADSLSHDDKLDKDIFAELDAALDALLEAHGGGQDSDEDAEEGDSETGYEGEGGVVERPGEVEGPRRLKDPEEVAAPEEREEDEGEAVYTQAVETTPGPLEMGLTSPGTLELGTRNEERPTIEELNPTGSGAVLGSPVTGRAAAPTGASQSIGSIPVGSLLKDPRVKYAVHEVRQAAASLAPIPAVLSSVSPFASPDQFRLPNALPSVGLGSVPSVGLGSVPSVGLGSVPSVGVGSVPSVGLGTVPSVGLGTVPSVGLGTVPSVGLGTVPSVGLGTVPTVGSGGLPFVGMAVLSSVGLPGGLPSAEPRGGLLRQILVGDSAPIVYRTPVRSVLRGMAAGNMA